jgi:hypothetical protein
MPKRPLKQRCTSPGHLPTCCFLHQLEGMSELGGEFRQVEQVATYVTFGGGCVTLPELLEGGASLCQNPSGTYLTELVELCRNFVARTSDHCSGTIAELVGTSDLAGTMADPSSGFMSLRDRPLAPSLRFCFHTDLPFPLQPPAPLQPTGGKHLMIALFDRNFAGTCRNCRNFRVVVISSRSSGPLASLLLPL